MNILVAITSYGSGNDAYLNQVVQQYRGMNHEVDIVILSNVLKPVPAGAELIVGIPNKDPWSLPFSHKRVFADRANKYDLFIYSEDDMLVTGDHVAAFFEVSAVLGDDECAGFLRIEYGADGSISYPDAHRQFHWDPGSLRMRGEHVFACFTCEHAACYMLTRDQLQRAIESGGFMVEPHQGKYDLACTAATDPYTQCGLTKVVCISDLRRFQVHHLSNKYVGTSFSLDEDDFQRQVEAMLEIGTGERMRSELLLGPETLTRCRWFKDYNEQPRDEILSLLPDGMRNLLSIGCGFGSLEGLLVQKGVAVVGIPLDSIISVCAEARGVKTLVGDLDTAWNEVADERFDCILIPNLLHLIRDPQKVLNTCTNLLSETGCIIFTVPNFNYLGTLWRGIRGVPGYSVFGDYDKTGIYRTSPQVVRAWLKSCDLVASSAIDVVPASVHLPSGMLTRLAAPLLAKELVIRAHKRRIASRNEVMTRQVLKRTSQFSPDQFQSKNIQN
jgi:SAM-dependent methyltransferase